MDDPPSKAAGSPISDTRWLCRISGSLPVMPMRERTRVTVGSDTILVISSPCHRILAWQGTRVLVQTGDVLPPVPSRAAELGQKARRPAVRRASFGHYSSQLRALVIYGANSMCTTRLVTSLGSLVSFAVCVSDHTYQSLLSAPPLAN